MADVNQVYMTGTLEDLTVRTFSSANGEFDIVTLRVKTNGCGTFHVNFEPRSQEFLSLLQNKVEEYRNGGQATWISLEPAFMASDYNPKRDKWYFKIVVRHSNLQLMGKPQNVGAPLRPRAVFTGEIRQIAPSGNILLLASKYEYFDKKNEERVRKERMFYVKTEDAVDQSACGKRVIGTGVPKPRLNDEWLVHVEATGLTILQ